MKMKAWAIVNTHNKIPENRDEPRFLCVHRTKIEALEAALDSEKVVPCIINYKIK